MSDETSAPEISNRSVSVEEIERFAQAIGLERAAPARCSTIFKFQLYVRLLVPEIPGDPNKIVAEIRALEGVNHTVGTKPAEQFQRPPLRGLWKKHYLVGGIASVAKNITLGFGKKNRPVMRKIIREHNNPDTAHLSYETISKNIADAITGIFAQRSREQRLTGDWIIFAKHQGQNYYLDLASHQENDADIFSRISQGCFHQFPFLKNQFGCDG